MNRYRIYLLLVSIIIIAGVLRFYQLTTIPPSLEWDEVATGYDANSILKTGKDQYGNFLPLTIRSIDDYKPPLYTYLTAGSIAVWGWNDFAVRFPAALLGTLSIITTYFMVRKLFTNEALALFSALLLAISPWHVNFSRLALETNSTIFFMTLGTWLFLKGTKSGKYLPFAAVSFGLNLYLYHNARVIIPLFGLVLLIMYYKELWQQKLYLIASGVIISLFLIRLIPIVTSIEGQMRFNGTSIFSSGVPKEIYERKMLYAKWKAEDIENNIKFYGIVFNNEKVLFGLRILDNYLSHFGPQFLLFTNDYTRHHMPEMGLIYFIELPLMIIGMYYFVKREQLRGVIVIFAWMLLAPLPAAVTRDVPHALRVEIILPTFQIFIGYALFFLYTKLSSYRKYIFLTVVLVGYWFCISFFLEKFYFHFAKETSADWQYGRREAAQFADSIKGDYEKVFVSTKLEQPHIFFLYYLKYDPAKYLSEGGTVSGGWAEERNHFDKYYFKTIDYNKMKDGKTLFIGLPGEFPDSAKVLKRIYYLNGVEAITIVPG